MRKREARIGMQLHMMPADISAALKRYTDTENYGDFGISITLLELGE